MIDERLADAQQCGTVRPDMLTHGKSVAARPLTRRPQSVADPERVRATANVAWLSNRGAPVRLASRELSFLINMEYEILRRQTTFWDLRKGARLVRIHFHGKDEFTFAESAPSSFAILDEHPLLIDYQFDWENIYIAAPVGRALSGRCDLSRWTSRC